MSGSPATALLQGLGRRKQARVKGNCCCGAQDLNSPGWCQLSSLSCPGLGGATRRVPVHPRGEEQEISGSTLGR